MSIEQKRVELEVSDLANVMNTAEGRRFVWRVLAKAGVHRQSFVPGAHDSTSFNEGQRSLGLWLYADLEANCPALYLTMQQEAIRQLQIDRKEIEDERTRRAASAE